MTVKSFRYWLMLVFVFCCTQLSAATQPEEKTGGWRLATESSPYLRLHADNPVEWFPWGEEAFAKARRENKPLFISVGYFTCHWCHVMARESFSNPEIAEQLNAGFVAIKIDREQRPDIDAAYMKYVTLTRGQGGWPMSVWATPDGDPFLGGTYFPPESSPGRQGMKQLLDTLMQLWETDEESIRQTATAAIATLKKLGGSVAPLKQLTQEPLLTARRQYADSFDELQGGFGPAPKFPQPARLMFLLQDTEQASVDMALLTLDKLVQGGVYDQLGGGFHRYSTDFEWRVPHFEKMLYDQALVARAYLFAWRRSNQERYAETARAVLDFVLTSMRDERGGFYSALSADSPVPGKATGHPEEGAYYTWDWQQLAAAIPDKTLRDWTAVRFGLLERGNALSDPLGEMAGKNVLYRAMTTQALLGKFDVDLLTANMRNADGDRRLLQARNQRPTVPVDDKVVTVWNGYMITTLALAGRLLDEPRYIKAAEATAAFILEALFDERRGVLFRDWRAGERTVAGFCEDYAGLAEGLLALYKVTGNRRWLDKAIALVELQVQKFWDEKDGGFFSTPVDTEMWVREKAASDGVTLAANSNSIHVLQQLGELTGKKKYFKRAWQTAAWTGAQLDNTPAAMPYTLIRWNDLIAHKRVPDKTP